MSYLNNEEFKNNLNDELNSQGSNNNENKDEISCLSKILQYNINDDESSNNYEHFYLNKNTAFKTNKNLQNEFNNLNNNIGNINYFNFVKEEGNGLFIRDRENNHTLLFEEIERKKDLSEKMEKGIVEEQKEDSKDYNNIQIEIKENEEDKYEDKISYDRNKNKMPPKQYFIDDINKICNFKSKKEIIIKNDDLLNLENKISDEVFLGPKKRNRDKENEINTERKKYGRKKKDDINNDSLHNRDSQDNIVKKIKSKINKFLLIFINCVFNSFLNNDIKTYIRIIKGISDDKDPEKEDLLKDLDYNKTVNETKKERNLEFLKMPLKDYLSIDITDKFKTYPKNSNKKVIDEILKNEKDNEKIMFILNDLTLGDYIDIFLYKKELKDFGKISEDKINSIMGKFKRVDKLLKEIKAKENDNYYSKFFYIFYNFERWFFIKIDRQKKEKKMNEECGKIFRIKKLKKNIK